MKGSLTFWARFFRYAGNEELLGFGDAGVMDVELFSDRVGDATSLWFSIVDVQRDMVCVCARVSELQLAGSCPERLYAMDSMDICDHASAVICWILLQHPAAWQRHIWQLREA